MSRKLGHRVDSTRVRHLFQARQRGGVRVWDALVLRVRSRLLLGGASGDRCGSGGSIDNPNRSTPIQ